MYIFIYLQFSTCNQTVQTQCNEANLASPYYSLFWRSPDPL